jgi:hypothetical protein
MNFLLLLMQGMRIGDERGSFRVCTACIVL